MKEFNRLFLSKWLRCLAVVSFGALVAGCGGGGTTMAQTSAIAENGNRPGVTPFISFVGFRGVSLAQLASVRVVIAAKPGTASKPVDVSYTLAALNRRGYTNAGSDLLTLPVFGLYAGYQNQLSIES